ncbi:MAG TPA: (2Fe-2S) ferredoxin domain-containing protein [Firmicutes bacterium]|nr:(2Fe-2S) ferredoxin domain-containing protein [Bacillota bacterium]
MHDILVCVGSSCHLKGAYDVIKAFQSLIHKYDLAGEVELGATFCLEHCAEGVTIKVDGEIITGMTPDRVARIFEDRVLGDRGRPEGGRDKVPATSDEIPARRREPEGPGEPGDEVEDQEGEIGDDKDGENWGRGPWE